MFAMCYTKPKEQYIHIDIDPNNPKYEILNNLQVLGDYIYQKGNPYDPYDGKYVNINNNNGYITFTGNYLQIHYPEAAGYDIDFGQYYEEMLTYPGKDNIIKAINYNNANHIHEFEYGEIITIRER